MKRYRTTILGWGLAAACGVVTLTGAQTASAATLGHGEADLLMESELWGDADTFQTGYLVMGQIYGSDVFDTRLARAAEVINIYTTVFGHDIKLFGVSAQGEAEGDEDDGDISESAELKIVLVNQVKYNVTKSGNCEKEGYESCADWSKPYDQKFFEYTEGFWVGPFLVGVTAEVVGVLEAHAKARARVESFSWENGYLGKALASYGIDATIEARLSAGLGATVTASLDLIGADLGPQAKFSHDYNAADTCVDWQWSNGLSLRVHTLDGKVKVSLGGWDKTLIDWNGLEKTVNLGSDSDSDHVCL